MKSILKITWPALVGLATLFTACQSEPEVGTKLYDKGESSNLPKLYIHDLGNQGNKGTLEVVNANGELIAKKDTVKFYVRLSSPLDHDLEVSVAENPSATKQAGATALEKGAVNILTPTVTIAKGTTVSAEPIKVVAQLGNALDTLMSTRNNGAVTLTLNPAQGVDVASNYGNMNITVNYKESNLVDNGNTDGLTAISTNDYWVVDGNSNPIYKLYDGSASANNMWWSLVSNGPFTFIISLQNTTKVTALEVLPAERYTNWTVQSITVETSENWNTWTKQGEISNSYSNIADANPFVVRFTKPVTCKYIKVTDVKPNYWKYLAIGEFSLYK